MKAPSWPTLASRARFWLTVGWGHPKGSGPPKAIAPHDPIRAHRSPTPAPGRSDSANGRRVPSPSTDSRPRRRYPVIPVVPAGVQSAGRMFPRPVASTTGVSRQMIGG